MRQQPRISMPRWQVYVIIKVYVRCHECKWPPTRKFAWICSGLQVQTCRDVWLECIEHFKYCSLSWS